MLVAKSKLNFVKFNRFWFNCNFLVRFSTSKTTLNQIPDTFFTSLLSGRIQSLRDENGAIFIDRDPELFSLILNYLRWANVDCVIILCMTHLAIIYRTKDIDLKLCDIRLLRHEAEYYGISPLIKRLGLIEEMDCSGCGDLLFYCLLPAPSELNWKHSLHNFPQLLSFQTFRFKSIHRQLSRNRTAIPNQTHRGQRLALSFELRQIHLVRLMMFQHDTLILIRELRRGICVYRETLLDTRETRRSTCDTLETHRQI